MNPLQLPPPRIDRLPLKFHTNASVLRLDALDPVVSGNKWYKLRYYLEAAITGQKKGLITYGGAYSNHILATAAAARRCGLEAIGIIRGEEPARPSPTLNDARALGMQLIFVARSDYREKSLPTPLLPHDVSDEWVLVPEGGGGEAGVRGAATLLQGLPLENYTHIMAAVGTGTTVAGIRRAALPGQEVTGIVVLKGEGAPGAAMTEQAGNGPLELCSAYHFGGYARHRPELLSFMNQWFEDTGIPSDFVYTGKLFYAFADLALAGYFPSYAHVLLVHSGGLQGNRSLPKGTLIF